MSALATATLLEEARGCIGLEPGRAGRVLADLDHLAGELAVIGDVLGSACGPRASGPSADR
jgi:hypothetical protein